MPNVDSVRRGCPSSTAANGCRLASTTQILPFKLSARTYWSASPCPRRPGLLRPCSRYATLASLIFCLSYVGPSPGCPSCLDCRRGFPIPSLFPVTLRLCLTSLRNI